MSLQRCKFCGCTERCACSLIKAFPGPGLNPYLLPQRSPQAAGVALAPEGDLRIVPYEWLLPDVCTNPACVERAYAEARDMEFVEAVQGLIDMGLVDISDDDDGEQRFLITEAGHIEAARSRRAA